MMHYIGFMYYLYTNAVPYISEVFIDLFMHKFINKCIFGTYRILT